MNNASQWRTLIREYRTLHQLDGFTPQSRGQRFNYHIAEVLKCWGIESRISVREPLGEVDVAFATRNVRHILEAKWQSPKVGPAQISDFVSKISERPTGVRGVFLSMSGFTSEALERATRASANLILLDGSHWESILTGLTPPDEFFELVADRASFYGDIYAPLAKIIETHSEPQVTFHAPEDFVDGVVYRGEDEGVEVNFVVAARNSHQLGIASDRNDREALYLTTEQGIVQLNLQSRSVQRVHPFTYVHGNVLPKSPDRIYFLRWNGVGVVSDGIVHAVAGGFAGAAYFAEDLADGMWVIDNGVTDSETCLVKIAGSIGEEVWFTTGISGSTAHGAWISTTEIVIHGGPGYYIYNTETEECRPFHQAFVGAGLVRIDSTKMHTFDGHSIFQLDLTAMDSKPLVHLKTHQSVAELITGKADSVLAAAYFGGMSMSFAVVSVSFSSTNR